MKLFTVLLCHRSGLSLGKIQQLMPSGCVAVVSDKLSIVHQKVFCQYKM